MYWRMCMHLCFNAHIYVHSCTHAHMHRYMRTSTHTQTIFCIIMFGSWFQFVHYQRYLRMSICLTCLFFGDNVWQPMRPRYIYEIIGHSGESDWLPFVQMGEAPRDRVERLAVVEAMTDHAATARSGDNTLAAGIKAVQQKLGGVGWRSHDFPWAQ